MVALGHNSGATPVELLRTIDVYAELRAQCAAAGGQRAWAESHGLAPQHVNDVLSTRRELSDRVLRALGLVKVERYARARISATPRRMETQETQETGMGTY